MEAVSLADQLTLEAASEDSFTCDDPAVPAENTVTRAWRLAKEYVELPKLAIALHKSVPSQSGLGGGSSDAAGLLRGLMALTRGAFSRENAFEVAEAVGSDVPFFLIGGRAIAKGRGERLCPQPDRPSRWLLVAMPDAKAETSAAYARLDAVDRPIPVWGPREEGENDFAAVAPPASLEAISLLKRTGAAPAGLTGSGAACYGFFASAEGAEDARPHLEAEGLAVWRVRTLSREESLWTS